jgi:hypothetical protein
MFHSREMTTWLKNLGLSLLVALIAGALSYLIASAFTSASLLYQQQQLLQHTLTLLHEGGISSLAGSNMHEIRERVAALEAYYHNLSIQIGVGGGIITAIISYLWLERRAVKAT